MTSLELHPWFTRKILFGSLTGSLFVWGWNPQKLWHPEIMGWKIRMLPYPLVIQHSSWKWQCFMGESTMFIVIFHSYVTNYRRLQHHQIPLNHHVPMVFLWFHLFWMKSSLFHGPSCREVTALLNAKSTQGLRLSTKGKKTHPFRLGKHIKKGWV